MTVYPYGKGDGTLRWVSTGWLADHLKDEGLLILDCQPNIHEYVKDHIPGAVYWHEGLFRIHEGNIPTRWIPADAAQILFRTLGLDSERPVVVYSSGGPLTTCSSFIGDGLEQTMVAYTLIRYGLRKVAILDGGFEKWRDEGRPLTGEYGVARPSAFTARVRDEFIVGYDRFVQIKDDPEVIVLDARPAAWYEGQGPWMRPGHIPGAVSLPWKSLMDDRNKKLLRPVEEIRALAEAAGATPDKLVICSCGTGREATNEFLTFRFLLGYPLVAIFEGSFTEWIAHKENPVVTGKNPR